MAADQCHEWNNSGCTGSPLRELRHYHLAEAFLMSVVSAQAVYLNAGVAVMESA
jgi:hypothetical protein